MPHLHDRYDFVVSAFLLHRTPETRTWRVLLVHHKRYDEWLPLGGHIELDEDPEEALFREIREESGLAVRLVNPTPPIGHPGVKPLPTPSFVDNHRISATHRHIAFVYYAIARSERVRLHDREHHRFRWFTGTDLGRPEYRLTRSIRFYCRYGLRRAAAWARAAC